MIYYKQCSGSLLPRKAAELQNWVQWTHHSEGKTHCEECLKLDGCWFQKGKSPPCPHHPYCHCTLNPIPYTVVIGNSSTYSDYSKFDPYLFNTDRLHPHGKEKLFKEWGYTADDARWLQSEFEQQALEKYFSGDYTLGKLDKNGQRISIRITIPKKDMAGTISFVTGWMVYPNGRLQLTTPYGGK